MIKNISNSTFLLFGILSTILLAQSIYFINIHRINNNANDIYAQIPSTIVTSNKTFHAKGLIGSLVSHLISDEVIRSLGFAKLYKPG